MIFKFISIFYFIGPAYYKSITFLLTLVPEFNPGNIHCSTPGTHYFFWDEVLGASLKSKNVEGGSEVQVMLQWILIHDFSLLSKGNAEVLFLDI